MAGDGFVNNAGVHHCAHRDAGVGALAGELAAAGDDRPIVTYLLSDAAAEVTGQVVRLDKEGLSLLRPPGFPNAAVPLAERTAEAVGRAFDAGLGAELEPVGLGHWT